MNDAELLPARMINEFAYCPRLFYLMHVERQFADNYETVDGAIVHRRVDAGSGKLDPASHVDPIETATETAEPNALGDTDSAPTKSTGTLSLFDHGDLDESTDSEPPVSPDPVSPGNADGDQDDDPFGSSQSTIHARSVMLSSDDLGVIAKMDLVERTGNQVTPVDYKRGRPKRLADGTCGAWLPEKVQICLQALVLREHGFACDSGVLYFNETRQRVDIPVDDSLVQQTRQLVKQAKACCDSGQIPDPLVASPKCPKCSLVNICLPDETLRCRAINGSENATGGMDSKTAARDVRPMITARDERRPLYLNTQGLSVGKEGERLKVKEQNRLVQEVRLREINQINLHGSIQMSAQAVQTVLQLNIPILYFSSKHWFYGMASGLGQQNVQLRREQFRKADDAKFCLDLAQDLVRGKIQNCRTLLMRNHREPNSVDLRQLKRLSKRVDEADSLASLLGIEGTAARIYFQAFAGMIKAGLSVSSGGALGEERPVFDFRGRNRRPPRDPVNALLSLSYSLLVKDLTVAASAVGLDPHIGFYHQVRPGKPALALDLMEPFRPLISDSAVLSSINNRMVTGDHFICAGESVTLTSAGRRHFYHAYEQRMDQLVTHPLFGYRVSYRRLLEIQTRLLGRYLSGELTEYPTFTTR